jgi:hypothetical protein
MGKKAGVMEHVYNLSYSGRSLVASLSPAKLAQDPMSKTTIKKLKN